LACSLLLKVGQPRHDADSSFPQGRCGLCELAHSYRPPGVSEPLPIAVLVSGGGTNLQALLDTVHGREAEIVAVASSADGVQALERARGRAVPARVFARSQFAKRTERDEALAAWLLEQGARLVVLAGYMELLDEVFLERFPGAVINVHPSLLPAFPGLHAVEQALAYGVKVFGVTVHFVDAGVDTGPVILQGAVELDRPGGVEQVMERLRPLEHELLPRAVRLFALGAVKLDPQDPRRVVTEAPVDTL
jgi:phosphoribosylglycinamide formyltransferase-1